MQGRLEQHFHLNGRQRPGSSRGVPRTRLVGALVLSIAVAFAAGTAPASAESQQNGGLQYTGRAAAVYTPTGLRILNQQVVAPETVICQAGPLPPAGGQFMACNGNLDVFGLGTVNVLNQSVTGQGGTSSATSEVASVNLFPTPIGGGLLNLNPLLANIRATVLRADTSVTCSSHSESTSLATLTLNGSSILPANASQTNQSLNILNNGAIVTLNYQQYDAATNTATASPLRIEFPANGPLAGIISGTIFVSYAQSDLHGCPPPPVISEISLALMLPVAAIGLFGVALLVVRRRSRVVSA